MKIIQYEDGSAKLMFSDVEVEILKKQAFIEFPAEGIKHLANNLMMIATGLIEKLPEDKKNLVSEEGQHIAPKDE
tara:strand:- start:111 stop:335 length:225 start_codon:yes stop_codon:yes gene_type:complete